MQPRSAPLVLLLATLAAASNATPIHFINLCEDSMKLYGGNTETTVKDGASITYDLADDDNAAYRYGVSYQATQAEFAVAGSRTWYDISIIPSGPDSGPGSCSSLEDCKAVTGGVGFNVAMQIVPSTGGGLDSSDTCRVLSCLEDGCGDAYQFPDQADRTHSCGGDVEFEVIFCPNNDSSSSGGSASDFWVDFSSSSDSEANSRGSEGSASASEAGVDESTPASTAQATSSGSGSDGQTRSTVSSGASSSSSSAIYVASALASSVVVIGATVFAFQHRRAIAERWEGWRRRARRSSETLFFVRAKDEAAA